MTNSSVFVKLTKEFYANLSAQSPSIWMPGRPAKNQTSSIDSSIRVLVHSATPSLSQTRTRRPSPAWSSSPSMWYLPVLWLYLSCAIVITIVSFPLTLHCCRQDTELSHHATQAEIDIVALASRHAVPLRRTGKNRHGKLYRGA